jgi:hypothetical protein
VHNAIGSRACLPTIGGPRQSLLEVRAVTDPAWSAAGGHRDWTIVPTDLVQREIAPEVRYSRYVTELPGSSKEVGREQLFVTQISTGFEWHDSGGDSSEATADQSLSDRQLVPVMCQRCGLRGEVLGYQCDRVARQSASFQERRIYGIRDRRDRP